MSTAKVGIIMGSNSDLPVMQAAADILKEFGIPYEIDIVSDIVPPKKCLIMPKMRIYADFR